MIQRIQTIYIIVAVVFGVLSLFMPIAYLINTGMGLGHIIFNIGLKDNANGTIEFSSIPLFVIQVLSIIIGLYSIFKYKKRPVQVRLCFLNMILMFLWYAYLCFWSFVLKPSNEEVKPLVQVCFPFISLVFYFLAYKSIWKDEKLVRSADRIR